MTAMREITGEDVIGVPGQMLTQTELRLLVGLADGETPSQMAAAVGIHRDHLRHLEGALQAKLGAKTKTHIVTRGFVTGVLITRALCLLLCVTAALDVAHDDAVRNRTSRRGRTMPETGRVARLTRAAAGSAPHESARQALGQMFVRVELAA